MGEREIVAQAIFDHVRLWSMAQCLDLADAVLRRSSTESGTGDDLG